jgi:hypothetical protein
MCWHNADPQSPAPTAPFCAIYLFHQLLDGWISIISLDTYMGWKAPGVCVQVGTLFALLRYVKWMQKGLKATSDSYARLMAGLGEQHVSQKCSNMNLHCHDPQCSDHCSVCLDI